MNHYIASTTLPVGVEEAFAYHERPFALERLIPPWKNVSIRSSDRSLKPGSAVDMRLKVGPVGVRWLAQHTTYDPPDLFVDVQRSGPFATWEHRHRFSRSGADQCLLTDEIDYSLPWGTIGQLAGASTARKQIEAMFAYRHRVTRDDLRLAAKHAATPLRIAISGCSGLVGSRLAGLLSLLGHHVIRLERTIDQASEPAPPGQSSVAPWHSQAEAEKLSGVDAVVHLAGSPIANRRWNETVKQQIRNSRVLMTEQLAKLLAALPKPPAVLICASAIGFYGDRGDELLNESSSPGQGFLPEVAVQWEQACRPARAAGIRVANARLGVVLDPCGGALQKMLMPAKLFGGSLGHGRQWWSWVALDDVIGSIYHVICDSNCEGPFNVTAPIPITQRDFAKTLGRVISRPALIPAPAFALRAALGEMADALLLSSTRAEPSALQDWGYDFRFDSATDALRYCLGIDRLESIRA